MSMNFCRGPATYKRKVELVVFAVTTYFSFATAALWWDFEARPLLVWNQISTKELLSGQLRHRLSTAISKDSGKTWTHFRNLESLDDRDSPGPGERFRTFIEQYAPGASLEIRRRDMYRLRSAILHGSALMTMDQDSHLGWAPPEQNETDLMDELWGLTRNAMRNWLKKPPLI